jgi:tetratricopeptide (TPR) repeat protein
MGDVLRNLTVLAALAAFALPAAAFDGAPQATGAKKSTAAQKQEPQGDSAADEKSKSAAMVQQAFEAGIKAYGVGKNDEALRAFDAALRGGLPSQQMARMLYYRGLTYRKQGKPGLAISDLTSALWLKNGLSEAERHDAVKMRAVAYNEAGVSDVPAVPQSAYAEAPAPPGQSNAAPGWQTAMAGTGGASAPVSNAPAAPAPTSSSGGGGFFSSITNLFSSGSSGSSEPKAEEPPVTTASIGNSALPPAAEGAAWTSTTEVTAAETGPKRAPEIAAPFVTQVAAVDEPGNPAPAPAAHGAPNGKFRLQVAAVRSRSEAEAMASLLVGRHGERLGGRKPEVDEAVIGSMGTFYRVRLGPYANAKDPEQLCVALRPDGFDCLVVTQ